MADDVLTLARRFEPILYLHEIDTVALVPPEPVPSDPKRYLEKCALWKAEFPLDDKASWGGKGSPFPRTPMIAAGTISALPGETSHNDEIKEYLGKEDGTGKPYLVHTPTEERFLEFGGWVVPADLAADGTVVDGYEPAVTTGSRNRYAYLKEIRRQYDQDPVLKGSRFWYYAELFDVVRLRTLLQAEAWPGFTNIFKSLAERKPAILCYYFFFPVHEEPLAAPCDTPHQGKQYASFAGHWGCAAILLEQGSGEVYAPTWIGLTRRRDANTRQAFDAEERFGLDVFRWEPGPDGDTSRLPDRVGDHPKIFVARGTHSLYLTAGTHDVQPYPPQTAPQHCGTFDTPHPQTVTNPGEGVDGAAAVAKVLSGFALGGIPGAIAGALLAALEDNATEVTETITPPSDKTIPDVTPERGAPALVIHPASITLTVPAGAVFQPWAADQNVVVDGRTYDFIVDRVAQVWWPTDDRQDGYRGRWGPAVQNDQLRRRSGMKFPDFWRMFLIALAKASPQDYP